MKKHEDELADQQWFEEHLKESVTVFDAAHAPEVPDLQQFEALVKGHKQQMKKRLWKELLLFWLIAYFILGMMFWVLDRNITWFFIVQTIVALGGVGFVSIRFGRRKVRAWKS